MRRIRNGDTNWDGQCDVSDFLPMPGCYTGPGNFDRLCQCRFYDIDHDRDVDTDDLELFLRVYTGSPDPMADCNNNTVGDFEDLLTGTERDANFNAIPDACDIAADPGLDADSDGLIDAGACAPTTPLAAATGPRNRFLTLNTDDTAPARVPGLGLEGQPEPVYRPDQAVRVTIVTMPGTPELEGKSFWVGPPDPVCENSGQGFGFPTSGCAGAPGQPTLSILTAGLQCDPFFSNWLDLGEINVHDERIIPGATYHVEVINEGCALTTPSNFSAPLVITNPAWGDIVTDCATLPCPGPNGSVDITTDVTAVLDKFKNLATGPSKTRTDLEPAALDGLINISDVTFDLDAFRNEPYPFTPPPSPCG